MSAGHRHGTPECRAIFAKLSEYMDGELDPAACDQIEGHMGDCAPCQAFLESLRRTVRLVGDTNGGGLDAATKRRIVEDYRRLRDRGERS